jgi:hypothetical protein
MNVSEQYARRTLLEQNPELLRQVETLKEPSASTEAVFQESRLVETDELWPEPAPLGGELPAVATFDMDILPEALRPLVEDTAERMQVSPDFPATVTVLCLAGATGRRATIQPKAADNTFTVVPNLWGGIVAPPGMMKSPVITAITRPLTTIEAEHRNEYESAAKQFAQAQEESDLRLSAWREQYKAAAKSGSTPPERPNCTMIAPTSKRLITQDSTAEKLHELMRDNPAGILVIRDELTGWLATLDKPGREGERSFYLSAWNGDTGYTMDRIGRGSIYVDACCASILGGIQPARLRTYLDDALRDGPMNDGLLQRFQVLVYPDSPKDWRLVDRTPNLTAITDAAQVYRKLVNREVQGGSAFRFDGDAQQLFNAWLTDLETTKLRGTDLHPALVGHLAKYRSLMPSLALLFELADGGTDIVSLQHAREAAAWCDYLESHARRIYSMVISPERQAATELGRRLSVGWKGTERLFSVRDVYQNDWRALETPDAVRRALAILEDAGWVRFMPLETKALGGRPTELYAINPKVWRAR